MHACNQTSYIHCLDLAMFEETWYKLAGCLWIQWKLACLACLKHCSSLGRHVVYCRRFKSRFCMILLMHVTSASTTEQCRVTSTQVAYRRSKFSVCFCLPRNLWPSWPLADSLQIWSGLAPAANTGIQPKPDLISCVKIVSFCHVCPKASMSCKCPPCTAKAEWSAEAAKSCETCQWAALMPEAPHNDWF